MGRHKKTSSLDDVKLRLQDRLAEIDNRLEEIRPDIADLQTQEFELLKERESVSSALHALDGGTVATASPSLVKNPTWNPSRTIPSITTLVKLNGQDVILEPGYEIGKNSLGEDCIVPIGAKFIQMAEPIKPPSVATAVPSVSDATGFVEELP